MSSADVTVGAPAVGRAQDRSVCPAISVVIPTKDEAGNIPRLLEALDRVHPDGAIELIFVDDSDDGTPAVIAERERGCRHDVVVVHRPRGRRDGGLGGAVHAGLWRARAPWVCVMDADLQHPPELIDRLFEEAEAGADLVVASRFRDGGNVGALGAFRRLLSCGSALAAKLAFPIRLRDVSDPMSGFFLVRRDALDLDSLRPRGFKILLEIVARSPRLRVREVGFRFGERHAGTSKASLHEGLLYLRQLGRLRYGERERRLTRFVAVGASGLLVNTVLLAALTDGLGIYFLLSAIIATQGSSLWNFLLTDRWVFGGRERRWRGGYRLAMFLGVNNAALALRSPLLWGFTAVAGLHYLISNVLSLGILTLLRFAVADGVIWSGARAHRETREWHLYDIHGIVSVASQVRLPELERMAVAELHAEPTIRVRVGRVQRNDGSLAASANGSSAAGTNGSTAAGNERAPAYNGSGAGARANGAGQGASLPPVVHLSRLRYLESLGRFGFGTEIEIGERIEVAATPLLRHSPHVLYTNIVEPILRWTFVEKGYALVHAACIAAEDQAFLLTARTDTGKTTTCLKTLDAVDYRFLSDDLTLVRPDGRVLTYPKPLTISRHTLKAVKKPLLTRGERLKLIAQSRLHSRSGRRFAMLLARTHLPVATVNAVIQLLIPPPKYQVDRLVPGVAIAPEGELAGMVVIERGGEGERPLGDEALEVLMSNCEDAYGFPPYSDIEEFLHSRGGLDLRQKERAIVARALDGVPATLMRSSTMDWWRRIPALVEATLDEANASRAI
jgi:glycosyltransferase involved in cell wall biosynthesis